jgi:hypothetical protein
MANLPNDDEDQIPPEELEMAVEEATGKPVAGDPEDRLKAIEKRVAYLQQQCQDVLNSQADGKLSEATSQALLDETRRDLNEAKRQLTAWRAQHQGRN